jgi:hypothetical protein
MSKINWKILAQQLRLSKQPLDVKWRKYVKLCQFGWRVHNKKRDGLYICSWQWDDTTDFLLQFKQMYLDWCRNSGKTEKAALLVVFLIIVGFPMVWFSKSTRQYMRAQELFNRNPFIQPFKPSKLKTEISLVTNEIIPLSVLIKMDNASGPHPKGGVYDEFAEMDLDIIQKSFGMYDEDPYLLFISTPVKGSPTTTIRQKYETRTHTYKDCPWKNAAFIESLCLPGKEKLWNQEYNCVEIEEEGCIFTNIVETKVFPETFRVTYQGLDYGSVTHNMMVRVGWAGGMWYILKEKAFAYKIDDQKLQEECDKYPTEGESGGWNKNNAPKLRGITTTDFSWNLGQFKADRVEAATSIPICINPDLTPYTYAQMQKARFSTDGKRRVETKDLHNIAALFHAVKPITGNYIQDGTKVEAQKPSLPHHLLLRKQRIY